MGTIINHLSKTSCNVPFLFHFCKSIHLSWIRTDMSAQLEANTIQIHNCFNDLNQEFYSKSKLFLRFSTHAVYHRNSHELPSLQQWEQTSVHDLRTYTDISKWNCCLRSLPTATTSSLKHFDTYPCKSSRITFYKYSSMKTRALK